jgi:tetratricopeptide (TPR) repeat protein
MSSEKLEFSRAEQAILKNDLRGAVVHYKNIVDKSVKSPLAIRSAKELATINHHQLKNPKAAITYYKHVVLYSVDEKERFEAQKHIADLNFTRMQDYGQAVVEYSRLLELPRSPEEDFSFRMALARSHFYLSNFYQAQVEIDVLLAKNFDKEILFEALLLKANTLLSSKKHDEATVILNNLMREYPERSKTETIGLILAVTYEEQKNFTKAIEILELIKDEYPKKGFIESRIKTLKERQSYLPGARGWRK